MIKEKFTMKIENEEVIDRKALCLAVKNSAKDGTAYCSLLQDELTICDKCPLLFKGNSNSYPFVGVSASKPNVKFGLLLICDGIDMVEADYIEETENTVKVFEVEGR